MLNKRLGNILLKDGLIDRQALDFCLSIQRNNGGERIGRVMMHYDFINEEMMINALAKQIGWSVYQERFVLNKEIFELLGNKFCQQSLVFPSKMLDKTVFVVSRIDDIKTLDHIRSLFGIDAIFMLSPEGALRKAIAEAVVLQVDHYLPEANKLTDEGLLEWVELCINKAILNGATDVHFEPSSKALEIRMRIDGVLYFVDALRLTFLSKLVNIIFHKADVAISDFGHFHDARFTHRYLNRDVDIRVSHIPSVNGSSIVLRILDKNKSVISLRTLGYGKAQWDLIEENLIQPQGLTLIVGPTGCGKTTTLYAILNHLKSISRKIMTIEDPVEMHLPLMTQVQIQEKRDVSFSSAVRAFLRHDPDIILIGEIRDEQTAKEALRAVMTGHKVFATLHANRPVDALLRLNDLGVPFAHMAGNLTMIVTQRLVRLLCVSCKRKYQDISKDILSYERKYLGKKDFGLFGAEGCVSCHGGYKGRGIVSEVMVFDEIRQLLLAQGNISELRKGLYENNDYISMVDDARRLIKEGVLDINEAVRVLG